MSDEKPSAAPVAALIGDLVGSRTVVDRSELHRLFSRALKAANEEHRPRQPLRITVGDEFQGSFDSVGAALRTAAWLRLELAPVELRYGIGWGAVTELEAEPRVEDGPGWWAARDAIVAVEAQATRSGLRHTRTAYRRAAGVPGPDPDAVNAALLCRDHLVGSLSERSLRILRGLRDGLSQTEIADTEGVSASAVSQRVRGDGLTVVLAAERLLEGIR